MRAAGKLPVAEAGAETPAETEIASIALIALRVPAKPAPLPGDPARALDPAPVFGLLAMGSPDPRQIDALLRQSWRRVAPPASLKKGLPARDEA